MTDFLLNKEALREMAVSPAFKTFGFLAPLRHGRLTPASRGCSSCPQRALAPQLMSDSLQEVILQSLNTGGSYAGEVADLKHAVVAQVLVLPTQHGLVRI